MILNRQSEVRVNLRDAERFAGRLRRALRLGRRDFNVCFVTAREITRLNFSYRGKRRATDVLSFAWQEGTGAPTGGDGFRYFLGDVVISPRRARLNAREEGHSTGAEIRWLILHGVLHLLGYDHETDGGEMTALELNLRERLDDARRKRTVKWRKPVFQAAKHSAQKRAK